MITHEMPAILDKRSSIDGDANEYLIEGEDGSQTWKSEEYLRDNYGDCPMDSPISVKETQLHPEAVTSDPVEDHRSSASRIDSAQHLLQSISSDDDGSRSPSPVRRSPPADPLEMPSTDINGVQKADIKMGISHSPSPVTLDDILSREESEISSSIGNLIIQDRHPFISHAIKKYSHDMMLSLIMNTTFMSEIESWCRHGIDNQDASFVEDILLFVELLPVPDASYITSFFELLSRPRIFADTDCSLLACRIVDKWTVKFPKQFDKSNGDKFDEGTETGLSLGSLKASLVPATASSRPNKPPLNPRTGHNYRNRRPQQTNYVRKHSPRFSPGRSRRQDSDSDRRSPAFRHQSPPRRPPSPRGVAPPKMFDFSSGRRSDNDEHFSRSHPPRQSFASVRSSDSKVPYDVQSGSEYCTSRSSSYQRDSQRGMPRSLSPPPRIEVHDRSVNHSYRFDSISESRPREMGRFSSSGSANSTPYSRQPSLKYVEDPEKGHYSNSGKRKSYGRLDQPDIGHSSSKRQPNFDRPRDPIPGYKSSIQDSRISNFSYDDSYSRSRQSHLPSVNDRSVSSHSARSRSPPHSNDERMYMADGARTFKRYDEPTSKRSGPKDYRDEKPYRGDDRHSGVKDYRREFTQDFRRDEPQSSFRRNDIAHDVKISNPKRKPDFMWSQDGTSKSMRLSDPERKELLVKGACLYCRKIGHSIENCRTRPARS